MEKYRVTIFKDCHASHNVKFRNLAKLEAQSIERLARKSHHLVSVREDRP